MHCGLAHCPGAKSTHFSILPVVSFLHIHAISSRIQCNTADLPSGHWVPTLPSQYPGYQRKQSTWPWTSRDSSFKLSLPSENRLCLTNACTRHAFFTVSLCQEMKRFRCGFLQFNKKLDVNSLFPFAVRHFPTKDKNTPVFENASTFTE